MLAYLHTIFTAAIECDTGNVTMPGGVYKLVPPTYGILP